MSPEGLHIVALSGGADSVALLRVMLALGYRVEAAHCNFHLRGEESNRDEMFVKKLCDALNVKLHLIRFDTAIYAKLHQVSIEMAARELRYRYFIQLSEDIGAETVCVAHHRDDAVETFLMNLLRGSGIHGLTGIRAKNGKVVRPLLCVTRKEIEDYLHSIHQDYVTDSTNLEDNVLRNKIRLRLLPLLQEINPQALQNIDKTAFFLQEVEKVFDQAMAEEQSEIICRDPDNERQRVSITQLFQLPSLTSFLHEWLSPYGFNTTQTSQLADSLKRESGREFVTSSHILVVDRQELILEPVMPPMEPMKIPECGHYRYTEKLHLDVEVSDVVTIEKTDFCVTLDRAKVSFPLVVRPVRQGDIFQPFGMTGRKLVSDFLTDCKLSLLEKRHQLVVTDAQGEIVWVVGRRVDNRFRVDHHTSAVLRLSLHKM